jgi:KTSC domain
MQRAAVSSSTVRSVGYERGTLEVEFVGGAVYRYFDVPERVFLDLLRAVSIGSYFNEHVRDVFPWVRL